MLWLSRRNDDIWAPNEPRLTRSHVRRCSYHTTTNKCARSSKQKFAFVSTICTDDDDFQSTSGQARVSARIGAYRRVSSSCPHPLRAYWPLRAALVHWPAAFACCVLQVCSLLALRCATLRNGASHARSPDVQACTGVSPKQPAAQRWCSRSRKWTRPGLAACISDW